MSGFIIPYMVYFRSDPKVQAPSVRMSIHRKLKSGEESRGVQLSLRGHQGIPAIIRRTDGRITDGAHAKRSRNFIPSFHAE